MIALVDYGGGNVSSAHRALLAAAQNKPVLRVSDPDTLRKAERVVFPGQGAMPDCMARLQESGLLEALQETLVNRPFLGICVGQQMLFESSEEGPCPGLGVLPGRVERFSPARGAVSSSGQPLKVPHMGWNEIQLLRDHPVFAGLNERPLGHWFYFVHSFYAAPARPQDLLAVCDYGSSFTCAVARDNIVATQFHPEKSADAGLALLRNFLAWKP